MVLSFVRQVYDGYKSSCKQLLMLAARFCDDISTRFESMPATLFFFSQQFIYKSLIISKLDCFALKMFEFVMFYWNNISNYKILNVTDDDIANSGQPMDTMEIRRSN